MHTILLIEDEEALRSALAAKLRAHGYQVLQASNGVEGLAILSREHVDCLLVDILMPQMDGVKMLYELQTKGAAPIPTIVLTNLEQTALPQSVSKVLVKAQVSLDEIVDHVHALLN